MRSQCTVWCYNNMAVRSGGSTALTMAETEQSPRVCFKARNNCVLAHAIGESGLPVTSGKGFYRSAEPHTPGSAWTIFQYNDCSQCKKKVYHQYIHIEHGARSLITTRRGRADGYRECGNSMARCVAFLRERLLAT